MLYSQFSSTTRNPQNDKGVYLVFVALIIVVVLSVVGWSVDTGFLYRKQKYLQNALDMAAFAGASELNDGVSAPVVEQHVRALALENARLMGFSQVEIARLSSSIATSVSNGDSEITVSGITDEPNRILSGIPGYPKRTDVGAASTAFMAPISVVLLLDVSGSMNFAFPPPEPGEEPCAPGTNVRMNALKTAVNSRIIPRLKVRDQIGIVTFSSGAQVVSPLSSELTPGNLAATKAQLTATVTGLVPNGTTNIWTGLQVATNDMQARVVGAVDRQKIILLVTDGAPNPSTTAPPFVRSGTCELALSIDQASYSRSVNSAIEAQRLGYKVHAIGMGTNDLNFSNRYQSGDYSNVKSVLLSEIANDQDYMENPAQLYENLLSTPGFVPPSGTPTPYMWEFPCMHEQGNPITSIDRRQRPQGKYAFAKNCSRLNQMLGDVFREFRVRLR